MSGGSNFAMLRRIAAQFTFPGSGNTLTNFYNNSDVPQRFAYYGLVAGFNINVSNGCTYNAWPAYAPEVDEYWSYTPEDLGNLDDEYEATDDVLDGYLGELSHLTGSPAENKRQQIGQAQIRLDDIVRRALVSAQASDSNDINVWLDRIEPKLIDISKFFSMWYNGNFTLLSMRLDMITDDDAEILKEASDYMIGAVNEDVSMFELDSVQLEDLTELAETSYGDYTNILRTFLDAEYGISIIRPDALVPRAIASKQNIVDNSNVLANEDVYSVIPNPTNDCVRVLPGNNVSNEFKGNVYNSIGNLVSSYSSSHSNAFICFGYSSPGVYLVTVTDIKTGATEIHKIVLY
jgi:hypothetical protein